MKFGLAFLLCSYVAESCLPPLVYPEVFDTEYECLHNGYTKALTQLEEIGPIDVNEHRMYIKFSCFEVQENEETEL